MVQKEIKKKTKIYALIAVLSAIMLVSAIYTIGVPSSAPFSVSNVSPLKVFASIAELKNFLVANAANSAGSFTGGPLDSQYYGSKGTAVPSNAPVPATASTTGTFSTNQQSSYSTTNVQVAGVDEADTVKTDGQYIYVINQNYSAASQNNVYVVNANPQDPAVIAKIPLGNDSALAGMYLSPDGNELVVLGSNYANMIVYPMVMVAGGNLPFYPGFANYGVSSFMYVYDVSDKASPVLTYNYTMTGSYFDSRMIGNDVYMVISQPANLDNGTVVLPSVYNNDAASTIMPPSIYYTDTNDSYYTYTTFVGLDVTNTSQGPSNMTIMMSGTSNMYVSTGNMYVTCPSQSGDGTDIYRVAINGLNLTFQAEGAVPGYIINQYSMDEYNGYFRVATTTTSGSWFSQNQENNLYVLNMNLTIVGKLENMAPGENIYAARFIGDTCYLVTFHQTDPFFVIDLSNPQAPTVAGELNIPGYSSYLYPYDATHVIGVGEQTIIENGSENIDLKLSLFDVSNMNNPTEIANYIVPGNYTSSTAQYDPHAFLFSLEKQLLVIPVSITNYEQTAFEPNNVTVPLPATGVAGSSSGSSAASSSPASPPVVSPPAIIFSEETWQGAYVFNVNPSSGFTLSGTVTNLNATMLDSQGFVNEGYGFGYYYDMQNDVITRSLYIGNTLYTVSNNEVKLFSLTDLSQIAEVNLD
ncbi:MAG: beta-propeller domain-containing protein [Candidatus Bathyarchaeia archaeon]